MGRISDHGEVATSAPWPTKHVTFHIFDFGVLQSPNRPQTITVPCTYFTNWPVRGLYRRTLAQHAGTSERNIADFVRSFVFLCMVFLNMAANVVVWVPQTKPPFINGSFVGGTQTKIDVRTDVKPKAVVGLF